MKILRNSRKYTIFAHESMKISRIRQSESSDNRTRRHPVDLLAGHLFRDGNEQSEAMHDR